MPSSSFAICGYNNAKSCEIVSIPISSTSTPSIEPIISSNCSIWIFVEQCPQMIFCIFFLLREIFDCSKHAKISAFILAADCDFTDP